MGKTSAIAAIIIPKPIPIFKLRTGRPSMSFRRFQLARRCAMLESLNRPHLAALAQPLDRRVEYWHEDECEYGGGQHAAKNGRADRLPAGGASTRRDHERHHAEDESESCHKNG